MTTPQSDTAAIGAEARLATLAVLRAHWNAAQQGYVDLFVPFAVELAEADTRASVPVSDIARSLEERFGFEVPEGAVRTILGRAQRQGYGQLRRREFEVSEKAAAEFSVAADERATAAREQKELLNGLRSFASTKLDLELSEAKASELLEEYVERHASSILAQKRGRARGASIAEDEYIVGSFIAHVLAEDDTLARYLENVVVGSMLATALHVAELGQIERRFDNLTIYLDTPTLIDALGHAGEVPKTAVLNSLRLLASRGAKLACFEHTVTEVESVLAAIAGALRGNRASLRTVVAGSVEEHAIRSGLTSADLEAAAAGVRRGLAVIQVAPHESPAPVRDLTIDEAAAEELLQESIGYNKVAARRHDLDCLTAIYRLRHGRRPARIENAGAVFATPNRPLVGAARRLIRSGPVGVAMELSDLVTLAWLKQPRAAPDLPRLRMAADCYVAMRPSTQLIQRYVDEAQSLRARGELTDEEVHELRYGPESRAILMHQTRGNPSDVTDKTVHAVLDEYRQRLVDEAREDVSADVQAARKDAAEERERRETIEGRVRELEAAEEARQERELERHRRRKRLCERRARRRARLVGRIAFFGVGLPALVILAISSVSGVFSGSAGILGVFGLLWWIVLPFAVIAGLLGAANLLWGTSAQSVAEWVQRPLERRLCRRYLEQAVRDGDLDEELISAEANGGRSASTD